MKYKYLEPQGFCFGVKAALKKLDEALEIYKDKKIYLLGLIIHNNYIINMYKNKGVIILDDYKHEKWKNISNIYDSVIVFQAHGSSKECYEIAKKNNNIIIDATCPFVFKIHNKLKEHVKNNYSVYYIGNIEHPETIAALTIPGVRLYDGNIKGDKVYITNQTTLSYYDLEDTYNSILNSNNNVVLENLICSATRDRQKAILDDNECDFYIVCGDNKSSNSKKLYDLALLKKPSVFVESYKDLMLFDLSKYRCIGITCGASTPAFLVDEIINYLIDKYEK